MKRPIPFPTLPTAAALVAVFYCLNCAQAGQFPINTNSTIKTAGSAAFDGVNYLVGIEGNNLFNRANTNQQVGAQLLSQAGALAGPLIDTGRNNDSGSFLPLVAFDGTNYLLVWNDGANTPNDDVYGAIISPAGAVVVPAFPISQAAKDQAAHGVVFDGTNYLVVWDDHRRGAIAGDGAAPFDVYGQRVSRSGALVGGEIRISPADNTRDFEGSRVAFDGTNSLVIWNEGLLSGTLNTDVKGQLVGRDGGLVGTEIAIKADGVKINNPASPGLGFDGTNYLVCWHQDVSSAEHDLVGQLVSRAGSPVGSVVRISVLSTNASLPGVAFDGTDYLVAWVDSFGTTNHNCQARFLDRSGNPASAEFAPLASQGTNSPLLVASVFGGKQYLALGKVGVFSGSFHGSPGDIYGAFVSPFPYGSFPIAITSGLETGVSIAFDGSNYLVGIEGDATGHSSINAQLVSTNGSPVGPGTSIGRDGGEPLVAFGGTNYLLVWEDGTGGPHIYGQRISKGGALLGSAFQISTNNDTKQTFDYSLQTVAFDGMNFLVLWEDTGAGGTNRSIFARLVSTAGTLLASEITIALGQRYRSPSVAFDGTNYLVVWQNDDSGGGGTDAFNTYGRLVSTAGVPGSVFLISQSPSTFYFPTSLAFDGSNYLVTVNRTTEPVCQCTPANLDIYGRFVSRGGAPAGNEFPIATAPGSQWFPAVVFDGANYLAAWGDISGICWAIKGRYFNRAGAAISGEFTLYGSQGPSRLTAFGSISFAGGRPFALASYKDPSFKGGDVYGFFLQPARLDISKPVGGQLPLKLSGMPGLAYRVQATTNLPASAGAWTPFTNVGLTNATFDFRDTIGKSRRFYRAVQQ
jgi:hypothetical protein